MNPSALVYSVLETLACLPHLRCSQSFKYECRKNLRTPPQNDLFLLANASQAVRTDDLMKKGLRLNHSRTLTVDGFEPTT